MDDRFAASPPKSERRTMLRVVQRCLSRSLYVDRAILECVYGLYEEPELNPWIETGYDPDIMDQLKALDELIKRELPPEN